MVHSQEQAFTFIPALDYYKNYGLSRKAINPDDQSSIIYIHGTQKYHHCRLNDIIFPHLPIFLEPGQVKH